MADREPKAGVPELRWPLRDSGGTVTGNVTFQGTANTFAQGSINSPAMEPLTLAVLTTATYTLQRSDAGKVLVAPSSATSNMTVVLPGAAMTMPH